MRSYFGGWCRYMDLPLHSIPSGQTEAYISAVFPSHLSDDLLRTVLVPLYFFPEQNERHCPFVHHQKSQFRTCFWGKSLPVRKWLNSRRWVSYSSFYHFLVLSFTPRDIKVNLYTQIMLKHYLHFRLLVMGYDLGKKEIFKKSYGFWDHVKFD